MKKLKIIEGNLKNINSLRAYINACIRNANGRMPNRWILDDTNGVSKSKHLVNTVTREIETLSN